MPKTYQPRGDRAENWDAAAYDAARRKRGMTWKAVAKAAGISISSAHSYATGTLPPQETVPAIARALRVPQKALMLKKGA